NYALSGGRVEKMCLFQIHFKLETMPSFPVIKRSLASTDHGVRAGLQIKIGLCPHRLDNIHDRWKTPCRSVAFAKLLRLNVFRPNTQKHWLADKLARAWPLLHRQSNFYRTSLAFRNDKRIEFLFVGYIDEIHRRASAQ